MTNFIVSARKYRPARFEDVLGQEHISRTLKMALATDKMAQAFLFTGPRGVGKTTCARILAKALNCTNLTVDFEPCGMCESCRAFDENASFSIFELDAASNNSVDQIRSLIDQVRFPPQSGRYKIFIIDEVHMLSTAAFNAFLKTLEEPPSYVVFILATTEKHKIIPTILSRCQIFDFKRLTIKDIVRQLNLICDQENITASQNALHLIASKADGAMRDALSIFDRIAGSYENTVSYEAVVENLNLLDYTYFFRIMDLMASSQLPNSMLVLDQCIRAGFDPEVILGGLAEHFRQLLMCKDESTLVLIENAEEVIQKYRQQAVMVPTAYLLSCLDIASECELNFKTARNRRLHLEMALIKMIYLRDIETIRVGEELHSTRIDPNEKTQKKKIVDKIGKEIQLNNSSDNQFLIEKVVNQTQVSSHKAPQEVELIDKLRENSLSDTVVVTQDLKRVIKEETSHKVGPSITAIPSSESKKSSPINLNQFESVAKAVSSEPIEYVDSGAVMEAWEHYAQNRAGNTVRLIMGQRRVRWSDDSILEIDVASNFEKDALIKELPLLEYLRDKFRNNKIRLEVIVDEQLRDTVSTEPPKTPKQRYEILVSKNPIIKDLFEDLELKIEE